MTPQQNLRTQRASSAPTHTRTEGSAMWGSELTAKAATQQGGTAEFVQRRDAVAAREDQLGRCAAVQSRYYRLYVKSGTFILAVIYLRRVQVVGRSFAAAPTHVLTFVTPPAPAARNLCVGLRRPCRDQAFSRRRATRKMYSGAG